VGKVPVEEGGLNTLYYSLRGYSVYKYLHFKKPFLSEPVK